MRQCLRIGRSVVLLASCWLLLSVQGADYSVDFDLNYTHVVAPGSDSFQGGTYTISPMWSLELWNDTNSPITLDSVVFDAEYGFDSVQPPADSSLNNDYTWDDVEIPAHDELNFDGFQSSESEDVAIPVDVVCEWSPQVLTESGDVTVTVTVTPQAAAGWASMEVEVGLYGVIHRGWPPAGASFATLSNMRETHTAGSFDIESNSADEQVADWEIDAPADGVAMTFTMTVHYDLAPGSGPVAIEPLVGVGGDLVSDLDSESWTNGTLDAVAAHGSVVLSQTPLVEVGRYLPWRNVLFLSSADKSIVGSWWTEQAYAADDMISLTFYKNGTYVHYQRGDDGNGVEYGTYSYNSQTNRLVVTPIKDENGDIGLSSWDSDGETMVISGDVLTINQGVQGEEFVLQRVQSATSPVVGSWTHDQNGDGDVLNLTLYPPASEGGNSFYIHYEDGNDDSNENGVEYGTYTHNNSTGAVVTSILFDGNSGTGLSDWSGANPSSEAVLITGDVLAIDGLDQLVRVDGSAVLARGPDWELYDNFDSGAIDGGRWQVDNDNGTSSPTVDAGTLLFDSAADGGESGLQVLEPGVAGLRAEFELVSADNDTGVELFYELSNGYEGWLEVWRKPDGSLAISGAIENGDSDVWQSAAYDQSVSLGTVYTLAVIVEAGRVKYFVNDELLDTSPVFSGARATLLSVGIWRETGGADVSAKVDDIYLVEGSGAAPPPSNNWQLYDDFESGPPLDNAKWVADLVHASSAPQVTGGEVVFNSVTDGGESGIGVLGAGVVGVKADFTLTQASNDCGMELLMDLSNGDEVLLELFRKVDGNLAIRGLIENDNETPVAQFIWTDAAVTVGTTYTLAVTYQGERVRFFVNDVLLGESQVFSGVTGDDFGLGIWLDDTGTASGTVDNVCTLTDGGAADWLGYDSFSGGVLDSGKWQEDNQGSTANPVQLAGGKAVFDATLTDGQSKIEVLDTDATGVRADFVLTSADANSGIEISYELSGGSLANDAYGYLEVSRWDAGPSIHVGGGLDDDTTDQSLWQVAELAGGGVLGVTYQLAVIFEQSRIKYYVDGVLLGQSPEFPGATISRFQLGIWGDDGSPSHVVGNVDNVEVMHGQAPPSGAIGISAPQDTAQEDGGGTGLFRVSIGGVAGAGGVDVVVALSGEAILGQDYHLSSGGAPLSDTSPVTVTVPQGQSAVDIVVESVDEALPEADESVVMTLITVDGNPAAGQATVVIEQSDIAYFVLWVNRNSVSGSGVDETGDLNWWLTTPMGKTLTSATFTMANGESYEAEVEPLDGGGFEASVEQEDVFGRDNVSLAELQAKMQTGTYSAVLNFASGPSETRTGVFTWGSWPDYPTVTSPLHYTSNIPSAANDRITVEWTGGDGWVSLEQENGPSGNNRVGYFESEWLPSSGTQSYEIDVALLPNQDYVVDVLSMSGDMGSISSVGVSTGTLPTFTGSSSVLAGTPIGEWTDGTVGMVQRDPDGTETAFTRTISRENVTMAGGALAAFQAVKWQDTFADGTALVRWLAKDDTGGVYMVREASGPTGSLIQASAVVPILIVESGATVGSQWYNGDYEEPTELVSTTATAPNADVDGCVQLSVAWEGEGSQTWWYKPGIGLVENQETEGAETTAYYRQPSAAQVALPAIQPNGGTHVGSVDVTITTATQGAIIYYTTNGDEPTDLSTVYGGTFTLSNSGTLKARAFANGSDPSDVASVSFTVIPPTYTLAVVNGTDDTGTGPYQAGEQVEISATLGVGDSFVQWGSDAGGAFANFQAFDTTFTMPAADVVVTATIARSPTFTRLLNAAACSNGVAEVEITFAAMNGQSDAMDEDGNVVGYRVMSITSGSLRIGATAQSAVAWDPGVNDVISDGMNAYWLPDGTAGTVDAFVVKAVDNDSSASATGVDVRVNVITAPADEIDFYLEVDEGWSLVSIPVAPADNSVAAVFGDATVWEWDGRRMRIATVVVPGKGYQLYREFGTGAAVLTITGSVPQTTSVTLKRGWHLLGSIGCVPYAALALPLHANTGDSGFTRNGRRLERLSTMPAGVGVWLKVSANETVNGTTVELGAP